MRIHNDIAQSIDSRRSVLLVLLDLSAVFDTINHNTLLRRLSGYGLSGDVLAWLTSYLCNRTCVVRVKSGVSEVETITTGVPQGTVLGSLLFNAYIAPLTTLMRIHNDIAQSIDSRRSVLLVLLDLSAAFDTINHNTLLRRLSGYGLSGDVLAWLTSYLCNRTCVVRVKSGVSEVETITTGVPQGTVLGPLLFNAYIAPLTTLLQKHNIHHHLYADDTQLYITFPPTDHTQALARMEACVQDAKAWLCDNGLVMNDNKSQAIVIRSSSLRTPTSLTRVNICGQLVDTSPVIRDLGFTIDSNLTMTSQVASVCRSAYYHLSRIAKTRDSVSTTVCKSLIHGLVLPVHSVEQTP